MGIIDLQRRISEVGRIRIGQIITTGNKSRPAKLETFRLTSADQTRIHQAARLYGGTPQQWQAPAGPQWEIITHTDTLNVIVPPSDMAFSQHYELWSGGGCQRRCDGANESINQGSCLCDPDKRECSIHTRLSVMLRDLPGLGVWRIDTQGFYAAVELQGAVEVVQMAAGRGHMLPARLRLEQRMVKRPGQQTKRFAVPVLDIEVSPAQLLSGHRDPLDAGTVAIEPPTGYLPPDERRALYDGTLDDPRPALTPVPDTVPERPALSVAEQTAPPPPRKPRKNAAQPIPATGIKPRTRTEAARGPVLESGADDGAVPFELPPPDEPDDSEPSITPPQLKKLSILLREAGFNDRQAAHDFTASFVQHPVNSAKELTKREASDLIDTLENERNDA